MSMRLAGGAARDLKTLFETGRVGGDWTDSQLVEWFADRQGPTAEAAFAALIRRHGPMVWRVCRGVLNDEHDAQDAFQATFLVLVRKAGSIRSRSSVASWLYGVAHRVATRAKTDVARRRTHERLAATQVKELQHDEAGGRFAEQAALDEEIRRLPEKYRAVVVLCDLEGLTQEQAAVALGWPCGTVRGRLWRARAMMRSRLSRVWGIPAGAPTRPREEAVVPAALIGVMPRALLLEAGEAKATATISPAVVSLANGVARTLGYAQLKMVFAYLGLGLVTVSIAGGLAAGRLGSGHATPPQNVERPAPDLSQAPSPGARSVEGRSVPAVTPSPTLTPALVPESSPGETESVVDREPSAVADPLEGIVVDGDLGDWPKGAKFYPVSKLLVGGPLDFGGLDNADLTTSPDLSLGFSVGYNRKEQLLYLAVVVRDDKLVIGHTSHLDTDALEVYIDGLHSERSVPTPDGSRFWDSKSLAEFPVQQYIAIPGSGKIYGSPHTTNPVLLGGDLARTRTKMAYRRVGDYTTYEWAIEPFDRYPDQPTRLEPGKRIGFDLAVADRDAPVTSREGLSEPISNRLTWVYWGPQWKGVKTYDAGNLGDLILAPDSR